MTSPSQPDAVSDEFDALMEQVMACADRFGHRQHLHLTWLAVRRYGMAAATDLICDGIQRTARYAGTPHKYHATISQAWVRLVGHHAANGPDTFDALIEAYPQLLDKGLPARHYRSSLLASPQAKTGWVEPDLRLLPHA